MMPTEYWIQQSRNDIIVHVHIYSNLTLLYSPESKSKRKSNKKSLPDEFTSPSIMNGSNKHTAANQKTLSNAINW